MKCPNCDTECKDDFCIKCGTMLNEKGKVKISKKALHEHDIEIFVGNNSEKIIFRNFNLACALFNFLYYLYRKCYLFGIILFIIEFLGFYTWTKILNLNYIFLIFVNILFFMMFGNSIYMGIVKKRVKKHENKKDFKDILAYKGGTNIYAPFVALLIIVALSFIYYFFMR